MYFVVQCLASFGALPDYCRVIHALIDSRPRPRQSPLPVVSPALTTCASLSAALVRAGVSYAGGYTLSCAVGVFFVGGDSSRVSDPCFSGDCSVAVVKSRPLRPMFWCGHAGA